MMTAKQKLDRAIATGNNLKPDHVLGKEYYALWIPSGNDVLLEFIYEQCVSRQPSIAQCFSVVGVFWELYRIQPSMFRHDQDSDMYFIHKRKFKRHLKKAMSRSR